MGLGRSSVLVLASIFAAVWLGCALLPETHVLLRLPAAAALAALVGIGSQLSASNAILRRVELIGTRWIVPAGAVLAAVGWLSSLSHRPWLLSPLAAAGIVGLVCLQLIEIRAMEPMRGAAHAMNIAAGFGLAFGAYALSLPGPMPVAVSLTFLASGAVALVVLRGGGAEVGHDGFGCAAVVALAVAELAWLLYGAPVSPLLLAAVLVLALYATSGVFHAMLDHAAPQAYVEVGMVTLVALGAVVIAGGRM